MLTSSTIQPISPRETHLLAAFITLDFNIFKLAETEKLLPPELLAFTESPAIQAHLAALKSFADSAFALRSLSVRNRTIDHLNHVATATDSLIEKRRAASSIIRTLTAGTTPRRASSPARECALPLSDNAVVLSTSSIRAPLASPKTQSRGDVPVPRPSGPFPQPLLNDLLVATANSEPTPRVRPGSPAALFAAAGRARDRP